ncbi:ecdysteroid kinase domain-containing protein [Ditylenchus destructor]|uniref:Ecdysteroid kinase domain-containing protein n=1 Tax=Ditylenchus destructor TaxID=166010 RepID=A0AAD4MYK9_9BILA|nr:ecdysteroid kinase domain-containing protein [Ditylenchus destructor]
MASAAVDASEYFVNKDTSKETLADSVFSKGFIAEKLAENHHMLRSMLQKLLKIREMAANDICGAKGFCSQIYHIVVLLESSNGMMEEKISVILKVFSNERIENLLNTWGDTNGSNGEGNISVWKPDKEMIDKVRKIHNIECDFYNHFRKISKDILPLPEIYYTQKTDMATNKPGIIIMEDLTEKAYMVPLSKGLTVQQVKNVVECLAKFHYYLLCEADQSWKETFKKSIFEGEFKDCAEAAIMGVALNCNREVFEEPLKRLRKAVDYEFGMYCYKGCAAEVGLPVLLVHGDLWSNNLMWKRQENGKLSDNVAAIIDWQILYKGNFTLDIARLIVICCDSDVRLELESCIVEHYYEIFSHLMLTAGKEMGYNLEQLKKAYQYASINMAFVLCYESSCYKQSIEGEDSADESTNEKLERFWKRARSALDDTVNMLQKVAPEWLT